MPFVAQEHRNSPDLNIPGDRCYLAYVHMINEWKKEPRWTTADRLFTELTLAKENCASKTRHHPCERCVAADLAWQVFFQLHVMPYEHKKRQENGDI